MHAARSRKSEEALSYVVDRCKRRSQLCVVGMTGGVGDERDSRRQGVLLSRYPAGECYVSAQWHVK